MITTDTLTNVYGCNREVWFHTQLVPHKERIQSVVHRQFLKSFFSDGNTLIDDKKMFKYKHKS